jgi:striatin 1/3/4
MGDAGDLPVGQVNRLTSHPALPLLVTAHEDKSIRIFDILTGERLFSTSS